MVDKLRWTHYDVVRLMVAYASTMHLTWGVLLVFWPDSIGATPVAVFTRAVGSPVLVGITLWGVALMALVGMSRVTNGLHGWLRTVSLLPQQSVLLVSASASMQAVIEEEYADGTLRSWSFILADQLPALLLAAFYSIGILALIWCDPVNHHRLSIGSLLQK